MSRLKTVAITGLSNSMDMDDSRALVTGVMVVITSTTVLHMAR